MAKFTAHCHLGQFSMFERIIKISIGQVESFMLCASRSVWPRPHAAHMLECINLIMTQAGSTQTVLIQVGAGEGGAGGGVGGGRASFDCHMLDPCLGILVGTSCHMLVVACHLLLA